MRILGDLQPAKVFYYFEEISRIPHGSGNTKKISTYLVDFAKDKGLKYVQDESGNVIIMKAATPGYETEPALILQGHMDMVAVQTPDSTKDMTTDGLELSIDGDYVYAKETSLGGDDGIAIAYALAILDADDLKHPALEVVITVDEEIGLLGAGAIDLSMLKGSRMINLDSEEEGIFWTSCAGGATADCKIEVKREKTEGIKLHVLLHGLQGGHSGCEIHKEHGNSNAMAGRMLYALTGKYEAALMFVNGGLADNAIPRQTEMVLVVPEENADAVQADIQHMAVALREELGVKDPEFAVTVSVQESGCFEAVTVADTRRAAAFVHGMPAGVQAMSADIPGLVETSLNMGILCMEENCLHGKFSVRSSVESAKEALLQKLEAICVLAGGSLEVTGEYPGWKYRTDSPLRDKMVRVYQEMYGRMPRVEAIHAGLECGILGSKIQDLDCVSMGPDMHNVHTTEEKLSISSTAKVWEYLVRLLEEKDR